MTTKDPSKGLARYKATTRGFAFGVVKGASLMGCNSDQPSWVAKSAQFCVKVINGFATNDPDTLDLAPDLHSGEWEGELLLDLLGNDYEYILDAYSKGTEKWGEGKVDILDDDGFVTGFWDDFGNGFLSGFWCEVIERAEANILEVLQNGVEHFSSRFWDDLDQIRTMGPNTSTHAAGLLEGMLFDERQGKDEA